MNKIIEEKFVKKFIIKDKRDRTIYELFSSKKRDQIIHRLNSIVDKRYEILNESQISDDEFLKQITKVYNINSSCYVIADGIDDGKSLPFKVAFKHMVDDCADYIIICDENVVVMKEEAIMGIPSTKKILFRQL